MTRPGRPRLDCSQIPFIAFLPLNFRQHGSLPFQAKGRPGKKNTEKDGKDYQTSQRQPRQFPIWNTTSQPPALRFPSFPLPQQAKKQPARPHGGRRRVLAQGQVASASIEMARKAPL